LKIAVKKNVMKPEKSINVSVYQKIKHRLKNYIALNKKKN